MGRFRVLVVCNRVPDIDANPQVEYLKVDFPAPSYSNRPETGMEAIRVDRGCKYLVGLIQARRYQPSHVMFFDADDLISDRIANFVGDGHDPDGWYIETGYQYCVGDTKLSIQSDFHRHCGSSLIYSYDMLDLPPELDENADMPSIIRHADEKVLKYVLGSHRVAIRFFQSQGFTFRPLPFVGAIWVLGNGENHSGKKGKPGEVPITDGIRDEFSFDPQKLAQVSQIK